MLCAAAAFTLMGAQAHALGKDCPWPVIALARTGLALFFTWMLARWSGTRLALWRPRTLWIRSIAGSISLLCTFYALTRLPVADVLTLTNMFPVWVALLSWLHEQSPPSLGIVGAIGVGVAGVFLVQQPHLAAGNLASIAALVASLATAVAMLGLHRLSDIDFRAIVVHFSAVSMVLVIAALFVFGPLPTPSNLLRPATLAMLLGVGVSATIGQVFLTKAFTLGPPSKVSVVGLCQVGFGMLCDVIIWNRTFNAASLVGMVLVIAPTAWLLWKWK